MNKAVVIFAGVMTIAGCSKSTSTPTPTSTATTPALKGVTQSDVTLTDGYLDFKTTFSVAIDEERTLRVTATTQPWITEDIKWTDELQQKDQKWIVFDCNDIADRIIDTSVIAKVAPFCQSVHAQATTYWGQRHNTPDEFQDSQGNRWRKQ